MDPKPQTSVSETSPSEVELTVVMPCLNEAETLAVCIRKAMGFFEKHGVQGEVVIADNGSTDGSQKIAVEEGARVVDVEAKGYGSALRGGIESAKGTYVIMADSDDSYDFSDLMPFLESLRAGSDLVMGNRFRGGIKKGAMPPLHRYLGNPVLTAIGRVFFRSKAGDFHCGLRGFSKEAFYRMELRTTGMEFASEMVVKATLKGMKIEEVPTTLSPDGRSRPPHLRSWRDGWRHLRFMLLYSPRWLFLYPGLVLALMGTGLGVALLPGPLQVGGVTLDVHSLVYASAMVLIGFQSVLFAMFTKVFAVTEGLLPEDKKFLRIFDYISLETGLVVGLLLIMAGLGGTIAAVTPWSSVSFRDLQPTQVLRLVIPSATSLALGCQIMLASFFLSVLGMKRT